MKGVCKDRTIAQLHDLTSCQVCCCADVGERKRHEARARSSPLYSARSRTELCESRYGNTCSTFLHAHSQLGSEAPLSLVYMLFAIHYIANATGRCIRHDSRPRVRQTKKRNIRNMSLQQITKRGQTDHRHPPKCTAHEQRQHRAK